MKKEVFVRIVQGSLGGYKKWEAKYSEPGEPERFLTSRFCDCISKEQFKLYCVETIQTMFPEMYRDAVIIIS